MKKIIVLIIVAIIIIGGGIWIFKESSNNVNQQSNNYETRSLADCNYLGDSWELLEKEEISLKFCYKKEWGNAEVQEMTGPNRTGSMFRIGFSSENYPIINYSTPDYRNLSAGDIPKQAIDWDALDFNKDALELARLLPFGIENAVAKKLNVNGKNVLKTNRDYPDHLSGERFTPVDYFMPNVKINGSGYNLHIMSMLEQESDTDTLVKSLTF